MKRTSKISFPIRQVLALISIPLTLSSVGYALFSQQLSVTANASKPAYSRSQNLSITYVKTISSAANKWNYQINVTIKNDGTKGVTAWKSDFSLPSDFTSLSCTNGNCTQSAGTNSATSTGTNGTIAPGGTSTYSLSFTSADPNYIFTSVSISGTPTQSYQTVTGLSVAAVPGNSTRKGQTYTYPYAFTVTNNSVQNLLGWRILIPWNSATNTVASISTTVDYTITANQLTILSKQPIASNTTFQFNLSIAVNSITYVLTGYTIEGIQ